jgi:hypothetical protein
MRGAVQSAYVPAVEGVDEVHTAQPTVDALQAVEQILDARMMRVQLNLTNTIEKIDYAFSE